MKLAPNIRSFAQKVEKEPSQQAFHSQNRPSSSDNATTTDKINFSLAKVLYNDAQRADLPSTTISFLNGVKTTVILDQTSQLSIIARNLSLLLLSPILTSLPSTLGLFSRITNYLTIINHTTTPMQDYANGYESSVL